MPEYLVGNGARLILQLLHHCIDGQLVLGLWIEVVHTCHKVACADIVEIVLQNVITTDVAFLVDHRICILLAVLADVLAAVCKIGVEHAFEFDTHHVAPFRLFGEVEQITLGHALHLRISEPLGVVLIGSLLQTEGAIDKQVLELYVTGLAAREVAVLHAIELTVLDGDIVDVCIFVETNDLNTILRLLTGNILHIDVANGGVVSTTADLIVLVVEVDLQNALLAYTYLDIAHVDVLDDATTARVGLDAEYALQFGRVHHAVVGIDILTTAGDFGANHYTTMTILHLAVADDDVLRGHVALTAVAVAPALDGNAVVASVEEAIFDKDAIAALRIAAVTIGTIVDHLHPAHSDIGRVKGMDYPKGGT